MSDNMEIDVSEEPKKAAKKKAAKKKAVPAKKASKKKAAKKAEATEPKKVGKRKSIELLGTRTAVKIDDAFMPLLEKVVREDKLENVGAAVDSILRKGLSRRKALRDYDKKKAAEAA